MSSAKSLREISSSKNVEENCAIDLFYRVCVAEIQPWDEQLGFYMLMTARNVVVIAALAHYSLTTVLFPALTGFLAFMFIVMVVYRRRTLL